MLPLGLLLSSQAAFAEAGKGLSRISAGDILWGIFLFGFALPAGAGYLLYWLLRLLGRQPSLTLTLVGAIGCWWLWLIILFNHR